MHRLRSSGLRCPPARRLTQALTAAFAAAFIIPAALSLPTPAVAADPPQVIDLLQFRTDDPGTWERTHRQSDSEPLTLEELEKLAQAGIGEKTLVEMMRTRKVRVVADAETLLRLKKAGASDDTIAAVSAYAMAPNTFFDLLVHLAVASPGTIRQAPYLYIEAWHTGLDRQEAFLHADLRGLLTRGLGVTVNRDRSDPLLPETIRSVDFTGRIETRKPGRIELRVLATQVAGLRSLSVLSPADAKRVRTFTLDYPGVSLEHRCRLDLVLERDALLNDAFTLRRGDLDCRWE